MYIHFCFAFWTPFSFWEAYFHKIKGREALSASHNFDATDSNTGLTENSTLTELHNACEGI
jgi:hypothetical protein